MSDCPNAWVAEDPAQPGTAFAVCDADPKYAADAAKEISDWQKRFGVKARLVNKADAKLMLAAWEREKSKMLPITAERPKVTKQTITQAAKNLAAENGWTEKQVSDLAQVFRQYMGGYELAKVLESNHLWSITASDVDALDCLAAEVRDVHREACRAWVIENNIQPALPIGTVITHGEITGICQHIPASYLVRENGNSDSTRRLVVSFEDAKVA